MKRMKKLLIGIFAFCMVLIGIIAIPKSAQAADSDFVIENGVLTKYNGSGGKVVIPNGVTEIGHGAFSECTSLTSITIPNSVTEIGYGAFRQCTSLTSIAIPNSVINIGSIAFGGCTSLKSITIPNSVTEIDGSAFGVCTSLQEINVNSRNSSYASEDGILYNKNKTVLICCPGGKTDVSTISIPNSVTDIGISAFAVCKNLTKVTIPSSVANIGMHAFAGCDNLKEVTILNSKAKVIHGVNGRPMYDILNWGDGPTHFKNSVVVVKGYKNSTAQELVNYLNKRGNIYGTIFEFVALNGTGEGDSNDTAKPSNPSKPNVSQKPDKTSSAKTKALLKKVKVTKSLSIKRKKSRTIKVALPKGLKKVTKHTNKSGQVKITYKSDKKKTAIVNSKGKVTAKRKGTAKITTTVKLKNGTKKTFITIVKVK